MTKVFKTTSLFIATAFALWSCSQSNKNSLEVAQYNSEMNLWHQKRVDRLLSPIGWLNVSGLFWLKEGISSFGSIMANDIVFPEGKIANKAGFFILQDSAVSMRVLPNVKVVCDSLPVTSMVIFHPDSSRAKILQSGSLQWFVIQRNDKIGIRLRDFDSPHLKDFKGIEHYEPDLMYRIKAKLTIQPGKQIAMANVLGQMVPNDVTGTLTFSIDDYQYKLDAIDEDGKLFIIFGDATNGKSTYGSGRYLYASMPESGDEVLLDFNQAINPPCAFTEFATCLLPPKQNILPIGITAGEKAYH